MRNIRHSLYRPFFALALIAGSFYCTPTFAQDVPSVRVGNVEITGIPDDWTHHHVVFSNPGTEEDAIRAGRYEEWKRVVDDPRYVLQQMKRYLPAQGPASDDVAYRYYWRAKVAHDSAKFADFGGRLRRGPIAPQRPISSVHGDWSMTSGGTGGLLPSHYPAKFGMGDAPEITNNCSDYVVFPTGLMGSTSQASVVIYYNLYTSCSATSPGVLLSINTGGLANTSPVISIDGTQIAYIQSAASTNLTVKLTSGSANFTTTGLTTAMVGNAISGAGLPTGTIIASRNSSTSGTLSVSATASATETATVAGVASLVLVKMAAAGQPPTTQVGSGTAVTAPVTPTQSSSAANYRSCTKYPCYITFALSGAYSDTNSAPFYVYYDLTYGNADNMYVGDDGGYLHRFTGVFLGTPAETATTNWPVSLYSTSESTTTNGTAALNSPVYDGNSGYVFVGDTSGYLHQVLGSSNPGTAYLSGHLEYNTNGMDPVIIDSSTGTDYVLQFVGYSDDTQTPTGNHGTRPSYINRFTVTAGNSSFITNSGFGTGIYFPNGATSTRPAGTSTIQPTGTFDNAYYTSGGASGNIYACSDGVLYQIPVACVANSTSSCNSGSATEDTNVSAYSTPTSAASRCSPVSEFYNTSTSIDYAFMSVAASAVKSGGSTCTGACALNYNITSSTTTANTPIAGLAATGGTSGIVMDNSVANTTKGGGAEIYYTTIGSQTCTGVGGTGTTGYGTGSCAVQATQAGLQ